MPRRGRSISISTSPAIAPFQRSGTSSLLQIIAAFVLALAVLLVRGRLTAAAGALVSAGTLGGYLLSIRVGLFGFREVWRVAGLAAGVIEIAGFRLSGPKPTSA